MAATSGWWDISSGVPVARNPNEVEPPALSAPLKLTLVTLTFAPLALADSMWQLALLILVDAFSSDAIPIHLLTREAMAIYAKKLVPEGLVVEARQMPEHEYPAPGRERRQFANSYDELDRKKAA